MSELTIKLEVPGLNELVQVLTALVGKTEGAHNTTPIQVQCAAPVQPTPGFSAPLPTQAPANAVPVQNGFVQQNAMPAPNTVPTAAMPGTGMPSGGVPTTAMPQEFTQDQLSVAAAGLVNQGKQARLLELLHGFGVNSLVELPKERYGEFATALRAEGAVI